MSLVRIGEHNQGSSTITMQVVRNFFRPSRGPSGVKFTELLLSIHIEHSFTKEVILGLYLNKIFFSHRAYGVLAAVALYYDKQLRR